MAAPTMTEDRVIGRVTSKASVSCSRALVRPDARVVDLLTEETCSFASPRVTSAGTVHIGAEQELAHAGARRERFELVDPAPHALVAMTDRAHSVENPAVDPLVRMRDASAAGAPIREPGERSRAPSSRSLDQTQSSASDALPAGIGDLAGDREGVLQSIACRVEAFLAQINQREQGLREGRECEPLLFFDELPRADTSSSG